MVADEEEVLDTRPPRPRRQLLIGAAALVAAGVVAVVATHTTTAPHPHAVSARPAPKLPPLPPAVVTSTDIVAAAVGDTVYAVDGGTVITIDLNTGARTVLRAGGAHGPDVQYRVLTDTANQRLWVVSSTSSHISVSWFDTTSLAQTGAEDDPGPLYGAAVLDGRLYLSTPQRVLSISQTEDVPSAPGPAVFPGEMIAADPVRHRLLVVRLGSPGRIWAQRPGTRTVEGDATGPFGKGDLAVSGGRIWAVGFGRTHAVIERLDPKTLRVRVRSPMEQHVGPGAVLVQTGQRHLLIRDGGGTGGPLWCLDAATGAVSRYWADVEGTPVLADNGVFSLVAGQPLVRVDSRGCTGG